MSKIVPGHTSKGGQVTETFSVKVERFKIQEKRQSKGFI